MCPLCPIIWFMLLRSYHSSPPRNIYLTIAIAGYISWAIKDIRQKRVQTANKQNLFFHTRLIFFLIWKITSFTALETKLKPDILITPGLVDSFPRKRWLILNLFSSRLSDNLTIKQSSYLWHHGAAMQWVETENDKLLTRISKWHHMTSWSSEPCLILLVSKGFCTSLTLISIWLPGTSAPQLCFQDFWPQIVEIIYSSSTYKTNVYQVQGLCLCDQH